jgi:hypothetical protein
MSPGRALSGYLLSPRRSCQFGSVATFRTRTRPCFRSATCALRSRAPARPKLRQTARAERSPRAAHEQAARDQPLRRTRSGSTKTGSHNSTSTSPPRNNERRKSSASTRAIAAGPPASNALQLPKAKRFYIYAPFAIELALRFRPFKVKYATGPFSRTRKIRIGPRE